MSRICVAQQYPSHILNPFDRSNPTLEFVAAPALKPAEVEVDQELMARYQEELKQVSDSISKIGANSLLTCF